MKIIVKNSISRLEGQDSTTDFDLNNVLSYVNQDAEYTHGQILKQIAYVKRRIEKDRKSVV